MDQSKSSRSVFGVNEHGLLVHAISIAWVRKHEHMSQAVLDLLLLIEVLRPLPAMHKTSISVH